ncbi:MAG: hypothetical protein ACM3N5_11680, partial [Candidatus Eiseniibacteriota bacterium]
MPKIPIYESQVSTGGVPQTPEAKPEDFGALTSRAIVGATQAGLDLADTVIKARYAAETSRGEKEATQQLQAAAEKADKDEDFATVPERFKQNFDKIRANFAGMGESAFRTGALHVTDDYGPVLGQRVRINAAKREAAFHRGNLDDDLDFYVGQAAAASNDLERQISMNIAKSVVARGNAAGYITRADALARLRDLPGRIEERQVEALIKSDPKAALEALKDKKRFTNLAPAVRDLWFGRATQARQKANFAAVSAVETGLADGTKTRENVTELHERGAIGNAKRDALYKQADRAEKERAEKAEGQTRVQSVLDEGGKLNPTKAKDRAAVDAHYDAVVAPANPDSPALVNYIRLTGVVPTKVARSIRGGLASDEPQQVVNAANLMREVGKHDDALIKNFGAKRLSFANAVMDGVDGGLTAKRAIDLADKSHGQPNASDGGGTESADAEGGSASDAGTEKAKGALGGEVRWVDDEEGGHYGVFLNGAEQTGVDTEAKAKELLTDILAREKQHRAQPAKGESGNAEDVAAGAESSQEAEARAADGSGGKNASSNAEGGTGVTSEAVGPEIQPVGGTEDSAGKSDQPNMLARFGHRIGAAIDRAFEQPIGLDPKDIQALREAGVFRTGHEGRFDPMATVRAFNEALIGGGIAGIDLSGRISEALVNVIAAAVAQTTQEFGESETGSRMLERDLGQLIQFMLLLGTTRGPGGPRRPPRLSNARPAAKGALRTETTKPEPELKSMDRSVAAERHTATIADNAASQRKQPAVVLTGRELGDFGDDVKALRKAAREAYRKLQGSGPVKHSALGDVQFTRVGWKEIEHTSADPRKLQIVPALREIIENAKYIRRAEVTKPRSDNIVAFHWVEADVVLDGQRLRVGINIAEDNRG